MKLWIDNTGLQSAGLCLDGRASSAHDYDVRGLLQLATLVIYGNNISLNGFEDTIIANRSHEIVQQLETVGITEDILTIRPLKEAEYALACKTAADSIAPNLCDGFNPHEFRVIGGEPPDLPRGLQERQVRYMALAREQEGSAKLQEVEENALTDKAVGAVEYMLVSSPALREAVARILDLYPNWDDRNSYHLNVFLRYHLNDALGDQSFSKYAPALARAELVSRRNQYVIDALGDTLDKAVADLRSEPLGVPSTLAALLQRAKGEPRAILKVARELRERSRPLRDVLDTLTVKYPEDTPESRFEIRKQVNELGRQLRRDVGLDPGTQLRDAVEFKFVIGIPVLSVSGKEIMKWVQEQMRSRRTAVLTELVKASAYSDLSTQLYEKLRDRSTRKSR
jgi:hypothetical protein